MKTLNVYSVKERRPANGETIFMWGERHVYDSIYLDAHVATVEYSWIELDKDGYETGLQIVYDENEEKPDDCVLMLLDSGSEITDDALYSMADDIAKLSE